MPKNNSHVPFSTRAFFLRGLSNVDTDVGESKLFTFWIVMFSSARVEASIAGAMLAWMVFVFLVEWKKRKKRTENFFLEKRFFLEKVMSCQSWNSKNSESCSLILVGSILRTAKFKNLLKKGLNLSDSIATKECSFTLSHRIIILGIPWCHRIPLHSWLIRQ